MVVSAAATRRRLRAEMRNGSPEGRGCAGTLTRGAAGLRANRGTDTGPVPVRLRPADPVLVEAALSRFRDGAADNADLRLLTKHLLALLVAKAPGGAVEVRVPPFAVAQCVEGTRHTRGTPPAVVEMDATTWISVATGALPWRDAEGAGRLTASGERSDLSPLLPLL